jgi:putative transposase
MFSTKKKLNLPKKRLATMVQNLKGPSLFQLIDRKKFDALAEKWEIDKGVRTFSTWELTQVLIHAFVFKLHSFREVEATLGIPNSTFSEALQKRHFGFFQELCEVVLLTIKAETKSRKEKKAVRELLAMDSSDIRVHGSLFNLSGYQQRCTKDHKAAVKLHAVWDVNNEWVEDFRVTPGRRGDSPTSLYQKILADKMYIFDRAYNNVGFWEKIINRNSHFVTRLKTSKRRRALERALTGTITSKYGVLCERKYSPTANGKKTSDLNLRHIVYRDENTQKFFHFVTSDRDISGQEVADIYKKRWAIELLFKWLKGHLNIRYLSTRTPNSIETQLATAVLVQLLLKLQKLTQDISSTPWEMLRELRIRLNLGGLTNIDAPADCRWSPASGAGLTT